MRPRPLASAPLLPRAPLPGAPLPGAPVRRPGLASRRLPVALLAALLAAGAASCDRRVAEPDSSTAGRPRPGWVSQEPAAPVPPQPQKSGSKRCITPTPATPKRQVVGPVPAPGCPADPTGRPDLRTAKVSFPDTKAPDVMVEVADTDATRARGLMYRKSMPENQGMIFVFDRRSDHSFWMRNTCIPLDMLFIDTDGTIVGIEENTTTLSDQNFQVGCPSTFVLEVNAGWTRRHGVVAGQKVKLEGV